MPRTSHDIYMEESVTIFFDNQLIL